MELYCNMLSGTDLEIYRNEPTSGYWDWVAAFTFMVDNTELSGEMLIKETEYMNYTLFYLESTNWPEGRDVIDSFQVE